MRQRAKSAKAKVEAKPPVTRKSPKNEGSTVRDLEKRLAESLEREKATGEILGVIACSPTGVQPTCDAIAAAAIALCEADLAGVFRFDGTLIHFVAQHGRTAEEIEAAGRAFPQLPHHGSVTARALLAASAVQIADVAEDPDVEDSLRIFRTVLSVPMIRDGQPLGAITVARRVVRPFTDSQVELVKTFADQAVIAIENVRLFNELEVRNSDLAEALTQQTTTSEILRVIAGSPTDLQPVLDALVESASRLCQAADTFLLLVEGDQLRVAAMHGSVEESARLSNAIHRGWMAGRAVVDARTVHVEDLTKAEAEFPLGAQIADRLGHRTALAMPLLRKGVPIGALFLRRREVRQFSDKEIALLQTFADQAVIAIENVRLFKELEVRNKALTEALDQQTATSEILRVISRSPTDVRPVFDTIARNARRLCEADSCSVFTYAGDLIRLESIDNATVEGADAIRRAYPLPPSRGHATGRAILTGRPVHIADVRHDPEYDLHGILGAGLRSIVAVPMLRDGIAIGTITLHTWATPRPFSATEIALLQTFADQAVIAIENVRLFTELQASNRELTTALDTQTATSDILRVISRSQTDVQPVFDTILASAVRLLRGYSGLVTRIVGDQIELAALTSTDDAGDAAIRAVFPQSHQSDGPHAQAMRDGAPINIADAQTDPRVPEAVRTNARARGNRSWVIVPLLRHDEAIGTIAVTRREPGGFTNDEIALLQTFADQAVIAIENARLLTELQARTADLTRSVSELRALSEVGQAVSSTLDLETVLTTIVSRSAELAGTDGGAIYEYDDAAELFRLRAEQGLAGGLVAARREIGIRKGEGAVGRLAVTREPIQIADIAQEGTYQSSLRGVLLDAGIRSLLAVPLLREDRLIGGLVVNRKRPGEFAPEVIALLQTFATQSALAIQNARLFREIADKSRQLEVASQHKSEFLANMSHELRTPLNAIIGFSEVLGERMFGELNEKQEEYLKDIHASGQHLLSLINDILDLSKIEAGRMELELTDFDLPTAIDSAFTLVRERAGRRGITLQATLDERLGEVRADERKIRQVVLNLLSNAIKFTPEGGRIEVRAVPVDGSVEVSVTDTGVGIAPEDQGAIFEEFRQVGTAAKKVEGTGLGLTLCRKFVELHGGRIWVKSEVGVGSTFTFSLPLRNG